MQSYSQRFFDEKNPVSSLLTYPSLITKKIPHKPGGYGSRIVIRSFLFLFKHLLRDFKGLDRLVNAKDPFVVVMNHNNYLESLLIPIVLVWYREGRPIRFLADWNFLMVPGVSFIFRCGQIIPVTQKDARPRFLNGLKKILVKGERGFPLAKRTLQQGGSIGLFPEGTRNSNPKQLLTGFKGAARLSLETGCPILPAGIRFPHHQSEKPISTWAPMELHFGEMMSPPHDFNSNPSEIIHLWHAEIMNQISILSGKHWKTK